ncbi:MAG: hypothetical protein BWX69_00911 [Planctomycetes bacterium ADurb.Bin069]|nr:MAG: hypothetical protein BWX69_00911 [Planctomycetes bacterium ADurb.Bin069]
MAGVPREAEELERPEEAGAKSRPHPARPAGREPASPEVGYAAPRRAGGGKRPDRAFSRERRSPKSGRRQAPRTRLTRRAHRRVLSGRWSKLLLAYSRTVVWVARQSTAALCAATAGRELPERLPGRRCRTPRRASASEPAATRGAGGRVRHHPDVRLSPSAQSVNGGEHAGQKRIAPRRWRLGLVAPWHASTPGRETARSCRTGRGRRDSHGLVGGAGRRRALAPSGPRCGTRPERRARHRFHRPEYWHRSRPRGPRRSAPFRRRRGAGGSRLGAPRAGRIVHGLLSGGASGPRSLGHHGGRLVRRNRRSARG